MDADLQTAFAASVAHEQGTRRLPSLTAMVGRSGVPLAAAAAGFADIENRVPATLGHRYRIGSITKTFTAAVTLLLRERGELELEAPVGRYLTETPFGRLPVRMLLSHSSGMQREAPVDMWESMKGPSGQELREAFGRIELIAAPGERWHYSNLGYAVLGQIIEQVTTVSCELLIDEMLLAPLELTATNWSMPDGAAIGYRLDPFADAVYREPALEQGAVGVGGQLWSTAEDLLRWGDVLCGNRPDIIPTAVVDAMHTLQVMVDTRSWKQGWGLGLILERHDVGILAGHTGAMPGFQAALTLHRDSSTVAVALSNLTHGTVLSDLTTRAVLDSIASAAATPTLAWEPAAPCPDHLRPILGSWWSESEETVFEWRHDGLHAHLTANPAASETRFEEEAPGRFRASHGRLRGELLIISGTAESVRLHWATYPFTRRPR
ncbi:serine hydrolase domain-containing protein [Nocardia sp. NPDC056100]|uniref:serine hydrolase domain-containing protein n=1 Tax=Nocardia sp. NPDC056100 TaxID=3345712 RepID=UPI0035DC69B3